MFFRALTFAGFLGRCCFALGFQHLPWNPANVNARKNMFDPYIRAKMTSVVNRNDLHIVFGRFD